MESNSTAIEGRTSAPCSLSSLLETARKNRREHFQRHHADPTDEEARDGYYYEEGRGRAYAEGLNAMDDYKAITRHRIESLKDHCRKVNPTWSWLMREILEIVDPQSNAEQKTDNRNTSPDHGAPRNISPENADVDARRDGALNPTGG